MMGPEFPAPVAMNMWCLVLYARQWCTAPEDIVQEAFLKLVVRKKLPDNVAAWLCRVVRNGAISSFRAAQRRRHHEGAAAGRCQGSRVPAFRGGQP